MELLTQEFEVRSFIGSCSEYTGNTEDNYPQLKAWSRHSSVETANAAAAKIFQENNPTGWTRKFLQDQVNTEFDELGLCCMSVTPAGYPYWEVRAVLVHQEDPITYSLEREHISALQQQAAARDAAEYESGVAPLPARMIGFEMEEVQGQIGSVYVVWTTFDDLHPIQLHWSYFNGSIWKPWPGTKYHETFTLTYRAGLRCLAPSPLVNEEGLLDKIRLFRALLFDGDGKLLGKCEREFSGKKKIRKSRRKAVIEIGENYMEEINSGNEQYQHDSGNSNPSPTYFVPSVSVNGNAIEMVRLVSKTKRSRVGPRSASRPLTTAAALQQHSSSLEPSSSSSQGPQYHVRYPEDSNTSQVL